MRGGLRRRSRHRELALQLLEALGADPLDVLHLLDRLERAVRLPVVEDRLRLRRADPRQRDELVHGRRVEVDRGERRTRAEQKR